MGLKKNNNCFSFRGCFSKLFVQQLVLCGWVFHLFLPSPSLAVFLCELKQEYLRVGPRAPSTGNHHAWSQHHINRDTTAPLNRTNPQARTRAQELSCSKLVNTSKTQRNEVIFAFRCHASTIANTGWMRLWLHRDLRGPHSALTTATFIPTRCNNHCRIRSLISSIFSPPALPFTTFPPKEEHYSWRAQQSPLELILAELSLWSSQAFSRERALDSLSRAALWPGFKVCKEVPRLPLCSAVS